MDKGDVPPFFMFNASDEDSGKVNEVRSCSHFSLIVLWDGFPLNGNQLHLADYQARKRGSSLMQKVGGAVLEGVTM